MVPVAAAAGRRVSEGGAIAIGTSGPPEGPPEIEEQPPATCGCTPGHPGGGAFHPGAGPLAIGGCCHPGGGCMPGHAVGGGAAGAVGHPGGADPHGVHISLLPTLAAKLATMSV